MEDKDKDKQKIKENGAATDVARVQEALKTFCCYLYVGKGQAYYKARPWNDDDRYPMGDRLRNLEVLASNKQTELVPIDKIKLAMDSKLIRRPETLMFALAMCARQKKSEKLRAAAYYFLAEHCKEWKYFILFIKYASILCKMEGSDEKDEPGQPVNHIGWGHGWKNAVNKWYFTQSPLSLCKLVMHHKGDCGWTHKDILKLSHPDSAGLEVEKQAILCYIIRGFAQAEMEYGSDPEAKKVLDYIRGTEFFKKCANPDAVAEMITTGKFTIDQVHPKALKSKKVWNVLLKGLSVRTILANLPKMNELGLLTKLSPATKLVVRSLTDEDLVRWNELLPGDVLPVLNQYEQAPTIRDPFRGELQKKVENTKSEKTTIKVKPKRKPPKKGTKDSSVAAPAEETNESQTKKEPKKDAQTVKRPATVELVTAEPDMRIRDALRTTLGIAQTVDITGSSKRTYLVSVRLSGRRCQAQCAEVGLAIALPLMHREDLPESAVTIVGYEPRLKYGSVSRVTKDMSFDKALTLLFKTKKEDLVHMPAGPLGWAYSEKKKYDVIINVTNEPPAKDIIRLMFDYKELLNLPDTRLINVINNGAPFELKGNVWRHCLNVNGFDPHVPWIIEAYVRGLF